MASDENRKKIVETAVELFSNSGIRGVTMDDIAAAMHISKRTLYETFANKEELLAECLMFVHDAIRQRHKQVYEKVDEPFLVTLFILRVNAISNNNYRRLIEEAKRYYPEIHDRFFKLYTNSFRDILMKSMQYAADKNYLRPHVDINTTVDFLCEMLQRHRLPQSSSPEEYYRKLNEIGFTFLRGLMSSDTIHRYEKREDEFHKIMNS